MRSVLKAILKKWPTGIVLLICIISFLFAISRHNRQNPIMLTQHTIETDYSDYIMFDFNVDGFEDIIVIDGSELRGFVQQNGENNFCEYPSFTYDVGSEPVIIWPTQINNGHNALLMLRHDGVSELRFNEKKLNEKKIISTATLIPSGHLDSPARYVKFTCSSSDGTILVIIPALESWQVYRYNIQKPCEFIQCLPERPIAVMELDPVNLKLTRKYNLDFSINDIDGDNKEDIVFRQILDQESKQCFTIYQQKQHLQFIKSNILIDSSEKHNWVCLDDINKDGMVDSVYCEWLKLPGILLIIPGGETVVKINISDVNSGKNKNYIFHKNDWSPFIPLVDINNDGFKDLVLGYHISLSKEELFNALSSRNFRYTFRYHIYKHGGFGDSPDFQTELNVCLNESLLSSDQRLSDTLKSLISFEGDFNGDGYHDLLVKDRNIPSY